MTDYAGLSLLDFIPAISPHKRAPWHLSEYCATFERALDVYSGKAVDPLRALVMVPIRHWKTWTTLHAIVHALTKIPSLRVVLFTHEHGRANELGKDLRDLADAADVGPERGFNTIADWRNKDDGGVIVMSAEQSKLGRDCHLLVFDDPLDESHALLAESRRQVDEAISHYTARCQRNGKRGPVIGVGSPWHPDDPFGRRRARTEQAWEVFTHPAIVDEGKETERAFAEDVIGLDELKKIRTQIYQDDPNGRIWQAQFMCDPKPESGERFKTPAEYYEVPKWPGFRNAAGIDLAYSVESGSDWFAFLYATIYGSQLFLRNVTRVKTDFNTIESVVQSDMTTFGACPIYSYMSGPEKGIAKYFADRGMAIQVMPARYDKSTRAQRTINAWNAGRILVPHQAPWKDGFVARCKAFTGRKDEGNDDEIDALVSLYDGAVGMGGGALMPSVFGERRYG
jgi:predicted phage terminase large subunit-like protein